MNLFFLFYSLNLLLKAMINMISSSFICFHLYLRIMALIFVELDDWRGSATILPLLLFPSPLSPFLLSPFSSSSPFLLSPQFSLSYFYSFLLRFILNFFLLLYSSLASTLALSHIVTSTLPVPAILLFSLLSGHANYFKFCSVYCHSYY